MFTPAFIKPRIVESLYCEALVLSDDVRGAFTVSDWTELTPPNYEDMARIALSIEGLHTTTRMMQAIAWLLSHRAFFMGEISETQLRRRGQLSKNLRPSNPQHFALLPPEIARLVETTHRFYERLLRLDQSWQEKAPNAFSAIECLRNRLEDRLVG